MPPPAYAQLGAELSELLTGADAEASLQSALQHLILRGLCSSQPDAGEPLSVRVGQRRLELFGVEPELAALLAPLLRLALLRIVEQAAERATRERLDLLSEATFEGILVHVDGNVIGVNRQLAKLMRCEPEDLLGPETMQRGVAPEDLAPTLARVASGYEGAYTITAIRPDGTRFRAELQSKQAKLGDRPVRVAALRDVTERERAAELLRESEQNLRDLALGAFDFMVVAQDGVVVDAGGDSQRVLGYTPEEMLGRPALSFVAPRMKRESQRAISENRPGAYETALLARDGQEVPVEVMGVRSSRGGAEVRVAAFRDLRQARQHAQERRRLEEQVQRAQRLDSLGVLAGGIAHDFNNLLVGVLGNASLLLGTLSDPLEREAAEAIMTAGERAATLTRQMLAYAGRQDLGRREPLDVGQLLHELRTLLDATLSKKAALELDIAPGSVVLGDRATLTQVLMNLLTNASDALENAPGRIEVRTRHVAEPEACWAAALGAPVGPGAWLQIEVEDNGVGMDAATRERVFEPFFSTKEHGHGLGLAACLGIVTSHGGALLLDSEPGRGSRFALLLPATEPREPAAITPEPPPVIEPCRVLVIDDEELVRTQLRRALELRGYEVDEAADGLSGLAAQQTQPADVLILDLTMPDIDGVEVLRRLREAGSRAAVVLSSGYHAHCSQQLEPGSYHAFLPKPYGLAELVRAVEQARARAAR